MHSGFKADLILTHDAEGHQAGAAVPPIFQTSTFLFPDFDTLEGCYSGRDEADLYSRTGNPTVRVLENKLAQLENGEEAIAFSSGMAAISSSILGLLKSGDRIVCIRNAYSDAYRLFEILLPRFGIQTEYVDASELTGTCDILAGASMLFLESPTSFVFETLDLKNIAGVARNKGVVTLMDNSFASPILQNPIDAGIDLVVHSASKYLSGHSDVVAGCVIGSTGLIERIRETTVPLLGAKLSAMEASLILRGLRTLAVRVRAHTEAADWIARKLQSDNRIRKIHRPGVSAPLPETLSGAGGLFTLELEDAVDIRTFCDALQLIRLGVSWGGFESLALPAAIANRQDTGPNALNAFGVSKNAVRIFAGLEGASALLEDIQGALSAACVGMRVTEGALGG
ncbi:MAG: PLP-dependent transferase [Roseibium sp.]|uniref:PLP-dependent transferase n=1 Tax=Roseibium sp. TaxID=1936156 RepID=UPI0026337B3B|nr:PLP-dependent transferase [Roseibium sp.]MCV0428543.1 PLP-dependent transferase [Roseibium sp.]